MGKLYTLDGKLLTETPEIRIGEKVYPVDNRTSTVKKLMKIDQDDTNAILKLAFGDKAAKEIADQDIPFVAYLQLVKVVIAAMTGEDEDEIDARFQKAAK